MAYINPSNGYRAFPPPNGNPRMMNFQNRYQGPPSFNNCPWRPAPERHSFNINRFMQPPHVQRPEFTPDNYFGQGMQNGQHENFPFNSNQNNFSSHNSFGQQNNSQHFHGHPGRGRGLHRGHRGGHGFRGGFNGGINNNNNNNNNTQQNNNTGQFKKKKIDKRDLPENNVFFCDICDRGFKTQDKYQEHINGHIKCSFKDCPFIAAPKLVQLHMNMQHRSGHAKKIWSLESEEDVKKWLEDRKRNYPTVDNVAKKKLGKEERIARGEVLENKQFGKMNSRNKHRRRGRWRGKGKRGGHFSRNDRESLSAGESDDDSPPEEVAINRSTAEEDTRQSKTVREPVDAAAEIDTIAQDSENAQVLSSQSDSVMEPSAGSLSLLASYGDSDNDDQALDNQSRVADAVPVYNSEALNHSASSLIVPSTPSKSGTDSADRSPSVSSSFTSKSAVLHHQVSSDSMLPTQNESNQSQISDVSINALEKISNTLQETLSQVTTTTSPTINEYNKQNSSPESQNKHSKKSDKVTSKNEGSSSKNINRHQGTGGKRGHPSPQQGGPVAKKTQLQKYTLLEKLLAPDIRRERNKILQCVHYIVKNNFFERKPADHQVLPTAELTTTTTHDVVLAETC